MSIVESPLKLGGKGGGKWVTPSLGPDPESHTYQGKEKEGQGREARKSTGENS